MSPVAVENTAWWSTSTAQEENSDQALSRQIHYALDLRDAGAARAGVETGAAARVLSVSLDRLAATLRGFLGTGDETDLRQVFEAYAEDHSRSPRT